MTADDVLKPLAVKGDDSQPDEFKGRSLKRVMHSDVLTLRPQQHQVALGAVALHAHR